MFSPPPSEQYSPKNATDNQVDDLQKHFMEGKKENLLLSYNNNNNIMLAAIISLLLVILFVLLLHLYAKWFLDQGRRRRNRTSVVLVSDVLQSPAVRLHHHLNTHTNEHDISSLSSSASPSSKGLNSKAIALIPLFTYHHAAQDLDRQGVECAICLSVFEEGEVGRSLPECCHGFHVDCIDMWLQSHSSCPICRAPVLEEEEACEEHIIHTDAAGLV